uniref:Uncharacterized protein n=1 Tax=Neospora caninum (strain Liverpool) TaxID=572307 RepID=F0JB44_NEOCL|nr:hypothetical protein NCLIV_069660 [Neospora caninum Liverpool]CEL71311.1 TPA: hypothetical protein BN1204_069660 [Neospora caninum Liverpool]
MASLNPFSWFSSSSNEDAPSSSSVGAPASETRRKGGLASLFFPSEEEEENRIKIAMRRYGYSLAELHSYPDMMNLPQVPQEMLADAKVKEELDRQHEKCQQRYNAVDTCVTQMLEHDQKSKRKYARLQQCKSQWISFHRCVSFRDKTILRDVRRWEKKHVASLPPAQANAYIEDLQAKQRYAEREDGCHVGGISVGGITSSLHRTTFLSPSIYSRDRKRRGRRKTGKMLHNQTRRCYFGFDSVAVSLVFELSGSPTTKVPASLVCLFVSFAFQYVQRRTDDEQEGLRWVLLLRKSEHSVNLRRCVSVRFPTLVDLNSYVYLYRIHASFCVLCYCVGVCTYTQKETGIREFGNAVEELNRRPRRRRSLTVAASCMRQHNCGTASGEKEERMKNQTARKEEQYRKERNQEERMLEGKQEKQWKQNRKHLRVLCGI